MAQLGYGYTHIQLQHLAGELAHSLESDKLVSPLVIIGCMVFAEMKRSAVLSESKESRINYSESSNAWSSQQLL